MKRAWYWPDKYPETKKGWSNSNWSALLIIIWRDDGTVWRNDDMTNQSQWSLSYFGIRRDILSVLSSNHFFSQQLNHHSTNHLLLFFLNMPMLNSCTFQSASGVNTITRLIPKRSGGDYSSGQQVVVTNLVSFWWRLICFDLDSWHGLHWPPFVPRVQDSWNGRLPLGSSPFQPWRVGEAQGSGANRSTPTILMENHQNGGDWSRGRREGDGRFYKVHETLLSHRDEALEDVEGSRRSSEFLVVFFEWTRLLTSP